MKLVTLYVYDEFSFCAAEACERGPCRTRSGVGHDGAGAYGKRELSTFSCSVAMMTSPSPVLTAVSQHHCITGFPAIARAPCRETLRPIAGRDDYQAVLDADY